MIKNKAAFVGAFIIFAMCMYLFFPFPNTAIKEVQFVFMSFPIQDQKDITCWESLGLSCLLVLSFCCSIAWKNIDFG